MTERSRVLTTTEEAIIEELVTTFHIDRLTAELTVVDFSYEPNYELVWQECLVYVAAAYIYNEMKWWR